MWAKRLSMLLVLVCGCGPELQDAADAKVEAMQATKAGAAIVDAARVVGILPTYTCGQPAQVEYADMIPAVQGNLAGCADVSQGPSTQTSSSLVMKFKNGGCNLLGGNWTGEIDATVSGGDARDEVVLDFQNASVNGQPLTGKIGRTDCGDLTTWALDVDAHVPATAHTDDMGVSYHGTIVDRPGIPIFGTDYVILDGPLTLEYGGRTVQAVFHQVWWELGLSAPHRGTMDLVDPDGRELSLRFDSGDVSVSVNGGKFAPVPMP